MINFTNREMANAFRSHIKTVRELSATQSQFLLLFYAVECGLKAVYMNQQHKKLTSECAEFKEIKHDIKDLAQRLYLSPKLYQKLVAVEINPVITNGIEQRRLVQPKNLNEVWRYCGSGSEKQEIIAVLHELVVKINEFLG